MFKFPNDKHQKTIKFQLSKFNENGQTWTKYNFTCLLSSDLQYLKFSKTQINAVVTHIKPITIFKNVVTHVFSMSRTRHIITFPKGSLFFFHISYITENVIVTII